jgi:hypothetical protein
MLDLTIEVNLMTARSYPFNPSPNDIAGLDLDTRYGTPCLGVLKAS